MSHPSPAIMWFRDDLRVADNPALRAATAADRPVLCIYVFDDGNTASRPLGGAARWWLHGALEALSEALAARGGRLDILRGAADEIVERLAVESGAQGVFWNRRYAAGDRETDSRVKAALKARGIAAESFNGALLREPWDVTTRAGGPFSVFTPFWRAVCDKGAPGAPLAAPQALTPCPLPRTLAPARVPLGELGLEPTKPDWAGGLRATWTRGENGARARLAAFLAEDFASYADGRDRPDRGNTSRLSPHLRFGEISPRQVWHAVDMHHAAHGDSTRSRDKFLAELGWREFSYHLLFHNPDLARRNFRAAFDGWPWREDARGLAAWQRGRTGFPIVDAGLRELWATGWMHNRVRMIAASFLTKHMLIDWRCGEAWFWDTLVDADHASNAASWQWVAGTGADAAPYFRIFNPVLQGEKFDPEGSYVRRWVPELAHLRGAAIHRPWQADAPLYPAPILDLDAARRRALEAWQSLRKL